MSPGLISARHASLNEEIPQNIAEPLHRLVGKRSLKATSVSIFVIAQRIAAHCYRWRCYGVGGRLQWPLTCTRATFHASDRAGFKGFTALHTADLACTRLTEKAPL
jgi:hypothetical protein